jgi:hypothetical protein
MIGIFLALFLSLSAEAAKLENVKVLGLAAGTENIKVKLHAPSAPKNSWFFVDVMRDDPEAFSKLSLLLHKLTDKDNFTLDLEIDSFTPSPSGSYYRSPDVRFSSREGKVK